MPSIELRVVVDRLNAQGWKVERTNNGHWKATPPDPSQKLVHFARCTDPKALRNVISDLKKSGFVWEDELPLRSRRDNRPTPTIVLSEDIAGEQLVHTRETFGQALRRLRTAEGIDLSEFGHLVGVTGQAVGFWEYDINTPITEHYERLCELLPELRNAPAPDTKNIAKPNGGAFARAFDGATAINIEPEIEEPMSAVPSPVHAVPSPATSPRMVVRLVRLALKIKQDPQLEAMLREAKESGLSIDDLLEMVQ